MRSVFISIKGVRRWTCSGAVMGRVSADQWAVYTQKARNGKKCRTGEKTSRTLDETGCTAHHRAAMAKKTPTQRAALDPDARYSSVADVAAHLCVSMATIRVLVKDGLFTQPFRFTKRAWSFKTVEVLAWEKEQRDEGGEE